MPDHNIYEALREENELLRQQILNLQSRNLDILENENKISFISETALKLLEPINSSEILSFLAERIYAISEGAIIAVNEYDPAGRRLTIREVRSTAGEKDKITRFFGNPPEGISFNSPPEFNSRFHPGSLVFVENGFYGLTLGRFPEDFCRNFEKALDIGDVYVMPCSVESDVLGTVAILTHSQKTFPKNRNLIESVVNQAALALKRHRAEEYLLRSREELLKSEEKYRQLVELANIIILRWNRNGTITYMNDYGLKFFGYTFKELVGRNISMLVPETESTGRNLLRLSEEILSKPEKYSHLENENIHRNGKVMWVRWANRAVKDSDGTVSEILAIGYDISRRKKAEDALKTEHDILDAVIHNIGIGFFVLEPDGNVYLSNEAALQIRDGGFERSSNFNLIDYFDEFILEYPDGTLMPRENWPILRSFRGEFVRNLDVRVIRKKSGTSRMVSMNSIPVYNNSGVMKLVVYTMRDFTDMFENTEALRESQQRYDSLFNNATLAIQHCKIITNEQGQPVDYEMFNINNTLTRITGITKEHVYGRKATEIFPGIERSPYNFIGKFGKIALEGGELNDEVYFGQIDKWFSVYAYSSKKEYFTAFFNDITERKRAEADLKSAKEKAEESDRLKSAFLANISHEIRTPMNGILGFADLLMKPGLSGESQSMYIEAINASGQRMLSIINDLVDISKIESGQIEIRKYPTQIPGLLNELVLFFRPEALKKGIEITLNPEVPNESFVIETDKTKLYQILSNLVKNSLKFTGTGGSIEIGCRINDERTIFFYVRDTGAGIRQEIRDKIFERFRQGDSAFEHEGVGLGLAISKAYVELLGGNIGVESEQGKGSVFYFTLPYDISTLPSRMPAETVRMPHKSLASKNILIVEDDEMSYILLKEILKDVNATVFRASNGAEAVEIVSNNPGIDLVLMDIKMPVMDGIEATYEIKKINPKIPVIIQSAYGGQEEIDLSFKAGSDDYLTKPIDFVEFLKKVSELID